MANKKNNKPKVFRINLSWFYLVLIGVIIYMMANPTGPGPQKMEWAEVQNAIRKGHVEKVEFVRNDYEGTVTIRPDSLSLYSEAFGGKFPKTAPHFTFMVSTAFNPEETFGKLNEALPEDCQVEVVMKNDSHMWARVVEMLAFPLLLVLMWIYMFRSMNKNGGMGGPGGPGGIFSVGKTQGKMTDKKDMKVTFKDVAGLYGAKEEVMEVVDFLKNPKKYTALGAKIPKGVLLVGPPGTGKTMLAKAVAGEADVPFFSISGSDFVEMFVGVGASRVRDLFRQAKEKAPCIVFIDEIDAVGRARGKNVGFSSNDERENTLNQLLTEMDGFGSNSGVIVMAATNRADILDKALMRAGRFDRQIHVELPDLNERKEIFAVHLKNIKLPKDFDLEFLAKHTPGFCGADIANVCNEAALIAARAGKKVVEKQDFLDAVDRIIGGLEKKSKIMTDQEKKGIALHESGHAMVSWLLPNANPLFKVTIVPRGQALGAAWYLPEEHVLMTKNQMLDEMCSLIGGRTAEELFCDSISTGASNDLERLTRLAYAMVSQFGMSEKVGMVNFSDSTGSRGYDLTKPYSEKTAEVIDEEARRIIDEVHAKTREIIEQNKENFLKLADILYEREVLFAEDLESLFGPKAGAQPKIEEQAPAVQAEDEPQSEQAKAEVEPTNETSNE